MDVRAYTEIDQQHPLFDGNRAWRHLHKRLGMAIAPVEDLDPKTADRFYRWADGLHDVLGISNKGPMVLTAPLWGY